MAYYTNPALQPLTLRAKCAVHACKKYATFVHIDVTQDGWRLSRRRRLYLCDRCCSSAKLVGPGTFRLSWLSNFLDGIATSNRSLPKE